MSQVDESKAVALVDHVGSALQQRGPTGMEIFLNNVDNVSRVSKALAAGGYLGERDPNVIGTHILTAMELGVPLSVVSKNVYKFGRTVGMMGALQLGLAVDRCGITVEHVTQSEDKYEGIMRRAGWVDMKLYFDTDMALKSRLLIRKPATDEFPEGELIGKSNKDGDVWDTWRRNMIMWKAINDGLRIMGADYFAVHQIYDMATAEAMEADYTEEHQHDASAELRGTLVAEEEPEDILPLIGELRELLATGKKAGVVDDDYKAEILKQAELGDVDAVKQAIEDIETNISAALESADPSLAL